LPDAGKQCAAWFVAWTFRHIIPLIPITFIKKDIVMRIFGIMLLLTLILQGCGRKGPLFLPPAPAAAPQAAPAQPAPEKSEIKK
jgi:predicted small lipoprotein YifL